MHVLVTTLLVVCFCFPQAFGQRAQRIMLAAHGDIIRSDNDGFFEKVQGALEGSFYVSRKFAVTGGMEWWSGNKAMVAAGARIVPIDEAFIRIRGLLGEDISAGAGFSKPLSDNVRIEAMADFYFKGALAIRAGIAWGLGPKP